MNSTERSLVAELEMAFGQVFGLEKLPDISAPTNRATQLILLGEIIRKSPKWRVLHIACNYSENGPIIKQITARRHFEREADVQSHSIVGGKG